MDCETTTGKISANSFGKLLAKEWQMITWYPGKIHERSQDITEFAGGGTNWDFTVDKTMDHVEFDLGNMV
jgi:hypothetical protein